VALTMTQPHLCAPEVLALDREGQNRAIAAIWSERELFATLAEGVWALGWNPEDELWQDLWIALGALYRLAERLPEASIYAHIRLFLAHLDSMRRRPMEADDIESPAEAWNALGLEESIRHDTNTRWAAIASAVIEQAGANDWERATGLSLALRALHTLLPEEQMADLVAAPAVIVLGSRPNRRVLGQWQEVWNRTNFRSSDLFYHDSRLRRALLDRNIEHAYRLVAVLAKAGRKSSELIASVVRASYDLDFADERDSLGLMVGSAGLLHACPLISPSGFYRGVAKLLADLANGKKRDPERIFYDEISLIKSREIIPDFRRAMLGSDFTEAWGYAEYAFVHGVEPQELFDELFRLSPSFYRGDPQLLWAWGHLLGVESLLSLLPEEYGIYIMAQSVRLMARTPKDPELLDPFPDEEAK